MNEFTTCENSHCGILHQDVKAVRDKAIEMDNRLSNTEKDVAVLAKTIEHVQANQTEIKRGLLALSDDVKENSVLVATASKHAVWTASVVVPILTGAIGLFIAFFLHKI